MDEQIKAQWVAALRSGSYQQGQTRLRDTQDRFCCIGVLCDLYIKATGNEWTLENSGRSYACNGNSTDLPREVAEWADLENSHDVKIKTPVVVTGRRPTTTLIGLNDAAKYTFAQIADVIEQEI